jgi:hypothetical protein
VQLEGTRQNDKVKINAYIAVMMQETHLFQERTLKLVFTHKLLEIEEALALTEGWSFVVNTRRKRRVKMRGSRERGTRTKEIMFSAVQKLTRL